MLQNKALLKDEITTATTSVQLYKIAYEKIAKQEQTIDNRIIIIILHSTFAYGKIAKQEQTIASLSTSSTIQQLHHYQQVLQLHQPIAATIQQQLTDLQISYCKKYCILFFFLSLYTFIYFFLLSKNGSI